MLHIVEYISWAENTSVVLVLLVAYRLLLLIGPGVLNLSQPIGDLSYLLLVIRVLFPWNIDGLGDATLCHLSKFFSDATRVLTITLVGVTLSYALLIDQVRCVDVERVHILNAL